MAVTMAYVEASVIVDGALEDMATFGTDASEIFDVWLDSQKQQAYASPTQRTEIYLMQHDHSPDIEDCSCGQYVQDHHPFWVFIPGGQE